MHEYRSRKGTRIDEAEAIPLLRQIFEALNYLHDHHIVHRWAESSFSTLISHYRRDVKMENFLFTSKGSSHLKMIDFGLAKFFQDNEIMRVPMGSPHFMVGDLNSFEPTSMKSRPQK